MHKNPALGHVRSTFTTPTFSASSCLAESFSRSTANLSNPAVAHLLQRDADLLPVLERPEAVVHLHLVVHFSLTRQKREGWRAG